MRRCSHRVSSMGNSNLVRCCLTWRCEVNGEKGPAGISYNEVDAEGKVCFARCDLNPNPDPNPNPNPNPKVVSRCRLGRSTS